MAANGWHMEMDGQGLAPLQVGRMRILVTKGMYAIAELFAGRSTAASSSPHCFSAARYASVKAGKQSGWRERIIGL